MLSHTYLCSVILHLCCCSRSVYSTPVPYKVSRGKPPPQNPGTEEIQSLLPRTSCLHHSCTNWREIHSNLPLSFFNCSSRSYVNPSHTTMLNCSQVLCLCLNSLNSSCKASANVSWTTFQSLKDFLSSAKIVTDMIRCCCCSSISLSARSEHSIYAQVSILSKQ